MREAGGDAGRACVLVPVVEINATVNPKLITGNFSGPVTLISCDATACTTPSPRMCSFDLTMAFVAASAIHYSSLVGPFVSSLRMSHFLYLSYPLCSHVGSSQGTAIGPRAGAMAFGDAKFPDAATCSTSSSATSTSRGHVRAGGVGKSVLHMASQFSLLEAQKQVKELGDVLLQRHDLLTKCRALVDRQLKKEKPRYIRHGVRTLEYVADYLVREALAETLGEQDMAHFTNRANVDSQELLYFAITAHPKFKLPMHEMEVNKFFSWCALRYQQGGSVLGAIPREKWDDWEWTMGCYSFVRPAEKGADSIVTTIRLRRTGQEARLPASFQPRQSEVGSVWFLTQNYSEETCVLFHSTKQSSQNIKALMDAEAPAAEVWFHV